MGTPGLVTISGKSFGDLAKNGTLFHIGTDLDHGVLNKSPLLHRSWALYPTRDANVYYQVLANMDPYKFLRAYDVDPDTPVQDHAEAYEVLKATFSKYSARELEMKNMEYGFCGQTCHSPAAWLETLMGTRLAAHPIVNWSRMPETADLGPVPFPIVSGDQRPLAGIKVVELARVTAAPALATQLAALGAEVVKVEPPLLPDPNVS